MSVIVLNNLADINPYFMYGVSLWSGCVKSISVNLTIFY